jgi:hypothetical protein
MILESLGNAKDTILNQYIRINWYLFIKHK